MQKLNSKNISLLPSGAYVSLEELQRLRHPAKHITSSAKTISQATLSGHHKSRAVNRGMEFEEVRQYQVGDDIRNIDWRVTARTQITHTKRYSEEKEKPIITAVDQRQTLFFGSHPCFKSVYACHLAALINWATILQGDRSGGIVLGNHSISETRPARSHKTVNRWLQHLATANQQLSIHSAADTNTTTQAFLKEGSTHKTLADLLQQLVQTSPTGTSIYIISDLYDLDERCEQLLFQLSRHRKVTLLWVVDQLEQSLPSNTNLSISDGNSSLKLTVQKTAKEKFHQQFIEKEKNIKALAERLKIGVHIAQVQTAPIDTIMSINL